ncbi:hypothetical protein [Flavihumibacter profundi]|uniref:hypothetical protein n=1 Tax=Flavihumibacter profundi TaxID=2716883 RepID=UPI001CC40498|nr:hypothetical protein [Flavihumibacter profundi]MBZ5857102.1 hypothetical protein [Flavihumibacter profundi]
MNATGQKWCRLALFNFFLVSAAGVLLRLKILISIPWLNFKFMLHAHSHFAFAGWVSLFLMAALVGKLPDNLAPKYDRLLLFNFLSAYGMFCSFPFQGYGPVSICFSTISVFLGWWFAVLYWKDSMIGEISPMIRLATKWSLVFLVISAVGTFFLAWLMANKVNHPDLYFGSVYFYLHFQYNGWFFFAIIALFLHLMPLEMHQELQKPLLYLALATIPAFFLSALWMQLPGWMYATACIAAAVQMIAFLRIAIHVYPVTRSAIGSSAVKAIWMLSLTALTIKFTLQALSVIPALSPYAFAYRPVVIGYLHLVLLGFVSLFAIGWLMQHNNFPLRKDQLPVSVVLFIAGILLTELTLMAQGITAMFYVSIPRTNEFLLGAAICLFVSIGWMNLKVKASGSTGTL